MLSLLIALLFSILALSTKRAAWLFKASLSSSPLFDESGNPLELPPCLDERSVLAEDEERELEELLELELDPDLSSSLSGLESIS